jgi:heme/copper-type cytochrome/quinol oxidase subunit 1
MYFAIAYDLWPHLTGRPLASLGLMRLQLWLWFVGMIVTTLPWHWVGILGMPRRMAFFDYADPALAPLAFSVVLSVIGGFILVHLSTPVEVCEQRDRKGLYAKARAGILKEFTGISDPYEEPTDAEVTVDTGELSPEEAAQEIILHLEREGFVGINGATG